VRQTEGIYRVSRLLIQLVIGAVVLAVGLGVVGYIFFIRAVDKPAVREIAERELRTGTLRFGERIERAANVYVRRPADYFRGANGVLAATDERLIFIGVAPQENLETPDAPPVIIEQEFVNDTVLEIDPTRVFFGTTRGVIVRRGDQQASYGATGQNWRQLEELARYVNDLHEQQKRAAARERRIRAAVARVVREPLYYTVRRGDAISTLATRFGITQEELQRWNNIVGTRINIGQTLLVKQPGLKRAPSS
jgi:plasmid stabilization system protein ParE